MRARVEQHVDRLAKEGAQRGAEVGGRGLERGRRLGREAVTDEVVHHADAQAVDREHALLTVDALVIALAVVPAEDPEHGSVLIVNGGSPTLPSGGPKGSLGTVAIVEFDGGSVTPRIIELAKERSAVA